MRIFSLFLFLVLFPPTAFGRGPDSFEVTAARVVDGDTLAPRDARGQEQGAHLRLWGIDAPEMGTDYSWAAGARLEAILRTGLPLRCESRGTDRNGRIVARCFTAGRDDVALLPVRSGLARDWAVFSKGHYVPAERAARRDGRGLWRNQ